MSVGCRVDLLFGSMGSLVVVMMVVVMMVSSVNTGAMAVLTGALPDPE